MVSSFRVTPLELLVMDDGDCLNCDVNSSLGNTYKDIKIENTDWHSRGKFLKAIGNKYPGGLDEFKYRIPSEVVYKDDDLLAVGFVNRDYSDLFTDILFCIGLNQNEVASVSQKYGFFYPESWLKLSKLRMDEGGYVVKDAYLNDEKPIDEFVAPSGWQFKRSLSDG